MKISKLSKTADIKKVSIDPIDYRDLDVKRLDGILHDIKNTADILIVNLREKGPYVTMTEIKEAEDTVDNIVSKIQTANEQILTLKARIAIRRESIMLQLVSLYTGRIREATTLEEAKFFNEILINETCFLDESPRIKELEAEMPKL